jgi:predicted phosphodiesterase
MNIPVRKDSKKTRQRIIEIPKSKSKILWLSDLHFPKQDDKAIDIALNFGAKEKVDVIVLGGDILDNTPFSRHGHETKDEDISQWFEMVVAFLKRLRRRFPKVLIYWLEGNHDKWFKQYIISNARVLQNDSYFTIESRLQLDTFGVQYLPETSVLKFADLFLHHGHLFFRGKCMPINPAKTIYSKANASVLCGHVHHDHKHTETAINGTKFKCYTTGCLSTLTPSYSPFANYVTGFAFVQRIGNKHSLRNLTIDAGLEG